MDSSSIDTKKMAIIPEKRRIESIYDSYHDTFKAILQNIEADLRLHISLSSSPTYKCRIKSFKSYYRKLLRVKKADELKSDELIPLTDIMGIRIICAFLEDLHVVELLVKKFYDVKEVEYKGQANFKEFGYESTHILIEVPSQCLQIDMHDKEGKVLTLPDNLICEIQIRTILQDAWAEVEHELVYKNEFSPFDAPMRRKLASINANLSLADIIFQEIRDYQKKLQKEISAYRENFYQLADLLTQKVIPDDEKGKVSSFHISRVSPYVRGTIDDMLLEAIHAHNEGDFGKAVKIYSIIIESETMPPATVLSVIHKHRGMAYFSQNNYYAALEDFKISNGYDHGNFRTIYYQGIVYSVLNKHQKACDCFSLSLFLNKFQAHAYYRRAVSHYILNEYEKSLADLQCAVKLGLEDDDCASLHKKLMKKFDMSM